MKEIHIIISEKTIRRLYALLLVCGILVCASLVQATAPNPGHNFTEVGGGITTGDILYGSAADTLAARADVAVGSYLRSGGVATAPVWSTPTLPNTATNLKVMIGNATNWVESTPAYPNASVTAGKVIVSDGTNYIASTPTFPNASATTRKIIVSDGTNWVASTETHAVPGATVGNTMVSDGTNWISSAGAGPNYHTILQAECSHTALKVAGTYMIGVGDPCAVSGTGTLYPIALIQYAAADYPTVNGVATKLRVRAIVSVNATAPTGNFTVGLYPITSGGGGSAAKIYTTGTLVTGSAATTVTAPAANSMTAVVGSDFTPPADGVYALAVVTTATVANPSQVEINAALQQRN